MIRTRSLYLGDDPKNRRERLSLPASARENSIHVLGQPGQGKSKFLEHLLRQDITNGEGVCLIDPHGSIFLPLIKWMAANGRFKRRKVVVFDASQKDWTFGFNPLAFHGLGEEKILRRVDALVNVFSMVWGDDHDQTPTLAYYLPALFRLLAENELTLAESVKVLGRGEVLEKLTRTLSDAHQQDKWDEIQSYTDREYREQVLSTRNRLDRFLEDTRVRNMVGQIDHSIDFKALMDERAVVLVNLGGIENRRKRLLGSMLVAQLYTAAMEREPDVGPAFHIYLDEGHLFVNEDVEHLITECRKFGCWLVFAHQDLAQLRRDVPESVMKAIMLMGTKVVFGGLPAEDAEYMAHELWMGFNNYERPKLSLMQPTVVGYKIINLSGSSSGSSEGRSSAVGASSGTGGATMYSADSFVFPSQTGSSTSYQRATTNLESTTSSSQYSDSTHEALMPELEDRPGPIYSLEETRDEQAGILKRQVTQHAVVQVMDGCPYQLRVPFVDEPRTTTRFALTCLREAIKETPFALPRKQADLVLKERREKLLTTASLVPPEPDYEG